MKAAKGEPLAWLRKHAGHIGDDCLIWPYARMSKGYAHMNGAIPHRLMCEWTNGPAPTPEHETAHSCGSGHMGCVNPRHLRWATKAENEADKLAHGTWRRRSKLTEDDVRQIHALKDVMPQKRIAERFGVSPATVCLIYKGKNWAHMACAP